FSVLIAFAVSLNAQTRGATKGERKFVGQKVESVMQSADPVASTFRPVKPANVLGATSRDLFKVPFASSGNLYSLLVSESTALSYNEDLNTVLFTHRQCSTYPDWSGVATASGFIQSSFSIDGGMTFDSSLVIYDDYTGTVNAGRYPSGVIYNPAGNTDPYEAYSVICGPLLADTYPGSGSWDGNFFASMKLDSTNGDVQEIFFDDPDIYMTFARRCLTACDDGTFHVYGNNHVDDGVNYTSYDIILNDGVWDADENSVEWTRWSDIPEYTEDSQGFPNGNPWPGYAWSKDGQIGYLVYTGNHEDSPYSWAYSPFAYKTENGGEDWDLMDIFDFRDIPTIYDSLFPAGGTTQKHPYVSSPSDVLVDGAGMLHYFTYVYSASSIDPDSMGWIWTFTNMEGILYDLYTTPDGGWDAQAIDFVIAKDVDVANDPLGVGYDARPQMSKSSDGSKVFYVWMDTDPALSDLNLFPDIVAQGADINSSFWTPTNNVTYLTQFWALDNYYMYCSDYAIDNGAGSYSVPVTTTRLGSVDLDPAYHSLLHGVDFLFEVGIDEKIEFNQISNVSQNYPNPFNGTSVVTVELTESSNLSIEVFNLMGQKVYGYNAGIVGSGVHNLTIDGTNLQSGVFFYTVKADETSVTRKMIVN
ncbi:MAG: T9SS type A sorting domain-containing protein, partial [Bacteroidales bacterium]|nr:T9SS type A sorting domain-containing protein [Bacteroidales bacterium]